MNKNFKGFTPETFMLLEMNKFNDSKEFYESVKEDIKNSAIVPMRQLAMDLYEDLYAIDDKMNLVPTKMVSRIRRDTRFSKNKQLYRANVWCMFMRDKHLWRFMPCMWFEYYPDRYSFGVGLFHAQPSDLEVFRQILTENQDEFMKALKEIKKTGAIAFVDSFKKLKPGTENIKEELQPYYNAKYIHFIYESNNMKKLIDGSVEDELRSAIKRFAPMYKFILKVTEKIYEKGDR